VRGRVGAVAVLALTAACTATPNRMPCQVYVADSFTPANNFAVSVDAEGWPALGDAASWIELGFFTPQPVTNPIDLVHVADTREIERWHLQVPTTQGAAPICRIGTDVGVASCGASIRVQPQSARGYYYLALNGNAVSEAGMSFRVCRPRP